MVMRTTRHFGGVRSSTSPSFNFSCVQKFTSLHRRFSSQKQTEGLSSTTSRSLRKFYLRVHPDLFSRFPQQRYDNEQSFQKLSSLVGEVKKFLAEKEEEAFKRVNFSHPTKLHFHIFSEKYLEGTSHNLIDEQAALNALKQDIFTTIDWELGPLSGSFFEVKKQINHSLKKLFAASGVLITAEESSWLDEEENTEEQEEDRQPTLKQYLSHVREEAMNKRAEHYRVERHIGMNLTVLRMRRGVKVAFLVQLPREAHLSLLEKLPGLLDKLPAIDLKGLTLCFSNSQPPKGIDEMGRIHLQWNKPETWGLFLTTADYGEARKYLEKMEEKSKKEARIAERLGFKVICAENELISCSPRYNYFLDNLEGWLMSGKLNFDEDHKKKYHSVQSLLIGDPSSLHSKHKGFETMEDVGLVIPIFAEGDLEQVRKFIETEGKRAGEVQKGLKDMKDTEYKVVPEFIRSLRVKGLRRDTERIKVAHMIECCYRLRRDSPILGSTLTGLYLFVSDKFAVLPTGEVSIKWNFRN
eukprot:TRINITY_DN9193_c0_g1_i1.p1 TRINITY_DN9193_c0_g1~~TRINITY_DN9193_c0_g1_i1.p1  ORF type:complete len:524 (-),score=122.40 TRINITY_DN9193_c0_g1_i1:75-1646(-)